MLGSANMMAEISKKRKIVLTLKNCHQCGKIILAHMISQLESN